MFFRLSNWTRSILTLVADNGVVNLGRNGAGVGCQTAAEPEFSVAQFSALSRQVARSGAWDPHRSPPGISILPAGTCQKFLVEV